MGKSTIDVQIEVLSITLGTLDIHDVKIIGSRNNVTNGLVTFAIEGPAVPNSEKCIAEVYRSLVGNTMQITTKFIPHA